MNPKQSSPITIIGCGPGSPDFITPAARQAAEKAETLVGAERLLDLFPNCRAEKIRVNSNLAQLLEHIAHLRDEEKKIAVLVTGDPGIFSLGRLLVERFGQDNCRFIPGISSVQVAFSALCLDWADAKIISAHKVAPEIDLSELAGLEKIAILTGRKEAFVWITELLSQLPEERDMYVCENLTLENERITKTAPAELTQRVYSNQSIVILLKKGIEQ